MPLRPLGVGETLDAAIRLYRLHWRTLMAVVAFVVVPVSFLQELASRGVPASPFAGLDPEAPPQITQTEVNRFLIGSVVLGAVWVLAVQPFLTAAMVRAVAGAYLGEVPTVGQVYRFALSRLPSVLWVIVLTFAGILGVLLLALILGALLVTAGAGAGLLVIPVVIGAAAAVAVLFVRWLFGPSVLVVEDRRGVEALGRSWRLARGRYWWIVGTVILANLLAGIVGLILGLVPGIIADGLGSVGWIVRAIGGSLASIVTTPFTTIVTVLLYFDLRIRKEGLDLAIMAQELSRPGP